jgi:hypothetical protein
MAYGVGFWLDWAMGSLDALLGVVVIFGAVVGAIRLLNTRRRVRRLRELLEGEGSSSPDRAHMGVPKQ